MKKETTTETITRTMEIRSAMLRKSMNIAFMNATNNATTIIANGVLKRPEIFDTPEKLQSAIVFLRNWFMSEYETFHKSEIDQITPESVNAGQVMKKIVSFSDIKDLRSYFATLPDSISNDEDVLSVAHTHADKLTKQLQAEQLPTIE